VPVGSPGQIVVEAIPIELDPKEPDPKRLGSLSFLGGFELRAADPRFGGLSGLALSDDGRMLYAVSDRGYWVSIEVRHDAEGRLTALGPMEIFTLLTPEGGPVRGRQRDSEGLARERDGSFIVSFEQSHRLWRYPPPPAAFKAPAQSVAVPVELAGAPRNGGIEAVAVLSDGAILIIAEEFENPDGSLKGWILTKGQFHPISYLPSEGFRATDAVALADGDVLVLERSHGLMGAWAARIKRIGRESLHAGARLTGEEMARLDPPLPVDNFEAIAVRQDPGAGTLIYIVSDDNYNPLQRTLLLQFRLDKTHGN